MSSSSKSLVLSATACERRCLYSAPPSLVSPLKVTALQGGGKWVLFTPKRKAQRGRDPGSRLRTRALITWPCSACKVRQTVSSWAHVTVCVCPPLRNAVKDTPPLGKLGAWLPPGEGALQPAGRCSVDACVVVVQLLSCVRLSATPWTAARQASQSLAIFQSSPKFVS